jgi:ankyrin repeat protein
MELDRARNRPSTGRMLCWTSDLREAPVAMGGLSIRKWAAVLCALAVATAAMHAPARPAKTKAARPAPDGAYPTLLLAAQGDSPEQVKALLDKGVSPNVKSHLGWTALHWAAYHGNAKLVRLLLDRGADVNARTINGVDPPDVRSEVGDESPLKTPLFAAAAGGRVNTARLLLDRGADPKVNDPRYGTALHRAAEEGETEVAALLLARGADPNARTKDGATPLHLAAYQHGWPHWKMVGLWDNVPVRTGPVDAAPVVSVLAAHGADVNARDEKGWTPLHWAAYGGHRTVTKALLQAGADPSLRVRGAWVIRTAWSRAEMGAPGQTVLHFAAGSGDLELVKTILARGVAPDVKDGARETPLGAASGAGQVKVVALLLSHGASAKAADRDGVTPLHLAAHGGSAAALRLLLAAGANPKAKTTRRRDFPRTEERLYGLDAPAGETPLHLAAGRETPDLAEELVRRGADVNAIDGSMSTPLHLAVNQNRPRVAELLLAHGARPNARDRNGWTPLHEAASQGLMECARVLIAHGADRRLRDPRGKTPLDLAGGSDRLRTLLGEKKPKG